MAHEQAMPDGIDFEAAVHAESGRLFAVAYAILRDVQDAEDAVQDTMEQAWHSWSALRDPSKRGAWLRPARLPGSCLALFSGAPHAQASR